MHDVRLPDWAVARGTPLNHVTRIDPEKAALIVIDMQSVFMAPGEVFGNPHAMAIVPVVNRLATAMRRAGGTVLWTRQTVSDTPPLAMAPWQYDPADPVVRRAMGAMRPGAPSREIHAAMDVAPGDGVIDKYRYSGFACPAGGLERELRARGIELLLIAGTLTNVCCESTARDAYMRGYRTLFLSDATAAVTDEEQNAALLNVRINFADVRDSETVLSMLDPLHVEETE